MIHRAGIHWADLGSVDLHPGLDAVQFSIALVLMPMTAPQCDKALK